MKIVITIEDTLRGTVTVKADPTFETLMKMITSGETSTSAMGYALACINKVREESRKGGKLKIGIPRLGRF